MPSALARALILPLMSLMVTGCAERPPADLAQGPSAQPRSTPASSDHPALSASSVATSSATSSAAAVATSSAASETGPNAGLPGASMGSKAPKALPDDMLGVPGGWFIMGQDDIGEKDEQPRHTVSVAPFLLDTTEVTNEDYSRCVEAKICRPHSTTSATANKLGDDRKFRTPKQPISGVSHDDAETYCKWVDKRLPTEAEWERAARGRDGRLYPWGNEDPTPELGVFQVGVTLPVGSKPKGAGPFGHLDLAGNVWEWVADRYDPYAYRRPSAARGIPGSCDDILKTQAELKKQGMQGFTGSNAIPDECEYVLRGGAFNYGGKGLRSSNRVHHPGRFRLVMSGFRCARDWPDGPTDPKEADAGVGEVSK